MNAKKFNKNIILAYAKFYDHLNSDENSKEKRILDEVRHVDSSKHLFDLL